MEKMGKNKRRTAGEYIHHTQTQRRAVDAAHP